MTGCKNRAYDVLSYILKSTVRGQVLASKNIMRVLCRVHILRKVINRAKVATEQILCTGSYRAIGIG